MSIDILTGFPSRFCETVKFREISIMSRLVGHAELCILERSGPVSCKDESEQNRLREGDPVTGIYE